MKLKVKSKRYGNEIPIEAEKMEFVTQEGVKYIVFRDSLGQVIYRFVESDSELLSMDNVKL